MGSDTFQEGFFQILNHQQNHVKREAKKFLNSNTVACPANFQCLYNKTTLHRKLYTENSVTYCRIALIEKLRYERNVFANPMMARSTSSKISQQQQYSCLPRYFSRLMDQITRGRAYIIGTGREDFIPTSQLIFKDSSDLLGQYSLVESEFQWTPFFKKGEFQWTFSKGEFQWTFGVNSSGQ